MTTVSKLSLSIFLVVFCSHNNVNVNENVFTLPGLFHRAIAQSGSALDPWAYAEPDFLRRKAFTIGERMNCSAVGHQDLLRCLQEASADVIVHNTIGQVHIYIY